MKIIKVNNLEHKNGFAYASVTVQTGFFIKKNTETVIAGRYLKGVDEYVDWVDLKTEERVFSLDFDHHIRAFKYRESLTK